MNPQGGIPWTPSQLADRLEALANEWRDITAAPRPLPAAELARLRRRLSELSEAIEAGDQDGCTPAVHRIALLGEVWECLESEPASGRAADVAGFCIEALRRLARDRRDVAHGGGVEVGEEILRQSDEHWGEYLAALDPNAIDTTIAEESSSFEESAIPQDEPPALEAQALLGLLRGFCDQADPATMARILPRPEPADEDAASIPADEAAPRREAPTCPQHEALEGPVRWTTDPRVAFPPLPERIDLDDEMREAFLADATELFDRIETIVIGRGDQEDARRGLHEVGRCLHTLKGAAGSVGLKDLAAVVHELEGRLGREGGEISPELDDVLHRFVDFFDEWIVLLRRGLAPRVATGSGPGDAPKSSREASADGPIRVPASRFEELTDLASELVIQGRFWLSQSGSMKEFAETARACRHRLLGSLDRLHDSGLGREGRGAGVPVDLRADVPAQLRRLAEQANDLAVLAESARTTAASMVARGDALVRVSLQLWDSFQSLRIVPIRGLFQRLVRVLHEAARVEGRQIEVAMVGEETGVDRSIQDRAFEPLLHMVRNAASHGIESPDERVRLGKPAAGRVTLEARREGNTLVIAVADDGQGLDDEAIAAKARKLGRIGPGEVVGRDRLRALIFEPGFSTRSTANAIAGRGVGMDVVAREIGQLRGTIDLDSESGRGTRLTVRLPARLTLEPALIVRVDGQPFAIPASQVEAARPLEEPERDADTHREPDSARPAEHPDKNPRISHRDQDVPVVFAREILGIGRAGPDSWPRVVLVRSGSRIIGLVVDAIDGPEDLIIKPLGELLSGHPLVSGTSLSVGGEVILVLNPSGLECWSRIRQATQTGPDASNAERGPDEGPSGERPVVLVVDDSISVRRGVARQLHALGFDVHEVSDGLEAIGRLRRSRYELVITDLEMPRLDGFALLAEMRRSPALATIPVVVASTQGAPETCRRVLELGAKALLSKPLDLPELWRIVEPFLAGVAR
jgi:chemotaxis protein histidine kinase CheA/CheY-like chemotaxis protein